MIALLLMACADSVESSPLPGGWHEVDCTGADGEFVVDAGLGPLIVFTGATGSDGSKWHQQPSIDGDITVGVDGTVSVSSDDPECRAWAWE